MQAGATVLAIEKDYTLADKLSGLHSSYPHFRCIQGDVLRVDIPDMIQQLREMPASASSPASRSSAARDDAVPGDDDRTASGASAGNSAAGAQFDEERGAVQHGGAAAAGAARRRVKLVANLPYNITTEILKQVFPMGDDISVVAFMLQDEVAQRLVAAKPGAGRRSFGGQSPS